MTSLRDQLLALAQKWREQAKFSYCVTCGSSAAFTAQRCAEELSALADQIRGEAKGDEPASTALCVSCGQSYYSHLLSSEWLACPKTGGTHYTPAALSTPLTQPGVAAEQLLKARDALIKTVGTLDTMNGGEVMEIPEPEDMLPVLEASGLLAELSTIRESEKTKHDLWQLRHAECEALRSQVAELEVTLQGVCANETAARKDAQALRATIAECDAHLAEVRKELAKYQQASA